MNERPLTGAMRPDGQALSVDEYERAGGYRALRKALKTSPAELQAVVKDSNLRGRGGAGFNTGVKWGFVPMDGGRHYMVANADEMEPGTFKDRMLLERNPHQFIEGLAIGAWAIQATGAIVFLRWEYGGAARRVARALDEARARGFIGPDILGSGFSLDIRLHVSAGRYICGEETALLNALEGRRAVPRAKPPFPQTSGLWGAPTVVNNVETLSNVPHIVMNGAGWYRSLALSTDGGTKIFGVSGRVRRPGLWELPMGTTIGEIIEEHAGGMKDGLGLCCLIPGGASTEFLTSEHLGVKMDFDSVMEAGSRLGTGTMIAVDDRTCPIGVLRNIEAFFARESCGWCTPCREGLVWVERTLAAIEEGQGRPEDMEVLEMHGRSLWTGRTYCALAPGAMEPLRSALKLFRGEFDEHMKKRGCPYEAR